VLAAIKPRVIALAVLGLMAIWLVPNVAVGGNSSDKGPDADTGAVTPVQEEKGAKLDDSMREGLDSARIKALREKERRKSPEAREERKRSRSAHRGLGDGEAVRLLKTQYGELFRDELWGPPRLRTGEKIERYVGDRSFVLRRADGKQTLVEAIMPVSTEARGGKRTPISTDLTDAGAELEAANAPAGPRIAKQLGGGVTLERSGISFRVVGDTTAQAEVTQDKATFANALTDGDVTVAAMPDGAETFFQLRSPESPGATRMRFNLPEGAKLELKQLADAGRGLPKPENAGAEIVKGDKVLAQIAPPSATDADGQRVPVSYAVEGSDLVVKVDHQGGDWMYPILVDPYVKDSYNWYDGNSDSSGWGFYRTRDGFIGYDCAWNTGCAGGGLSGKGLYIQTVLGGYPTDWSAQAQWFWHAPANTNIVRVDWTGYGHKSGASCVWGQITDPVYGSIQGSQLFNCSDVNFGYFTSCTAHPSCATDGSSPGNVARFGTVQYNGTFWDTWVKLSNAYIELWDGYKPKVDSLTAGPPATGTNGWVDNVSHAFRANVSDQGVGVRNVTFSRTGPNPASVVSGAPCNGSHYARCNSSYTLPGSNWVYNTNDLDDGIHQFKVAVDDHVGNTSDQNSEWTLKVDHTEPLTQVRGELWDHGGDRVTPGTHAIAVRAEDGTSDDPESGVESIELKVDGARQQLVTNSSCTGDNCALSTNLSASLSAGYHTIEVIARDRLGHADVQSTDVDVVAETSGATTSMSAATTSELRLKGAAVGDHAGNAATSVGDVNGDSVDDYAIGAPDADNNGRAGSGSVYVVYGGATGDLNLNALGTSGFRIDGAGVDSRAGAGVAGGGDVNGDGKNDIVVGSPGSAGMDGEVYVVFGRSPNADGSAPSNVDLRSLGALGFKVTGPNANTAAITGGGNSKRFGEVVDITDTSQAAPDVNGDGLADIVLGSSSEGSATGAAYTVFGKANSAPVDVRTFAAPAASPTPVAKWRLGEDSGTQANDSSGTNHGTYNAGVTLGEPGAGTDGNTAAKFDGTSGEMRVNDSATLKPSTAVSVEAWFKPSRINTHQNIVRKDNSYLLKMTPAGEISFGVWTSSGVSGAKAALPAGFKVDAWHHVVGTYDGANMSTYVDGQLIATAPKTGAIGPSSTWPLVIGNYITEYFQGGIDEVALYDRALTASEVFAQYRRDNAAGFRIGGAGAGEGAGYSAASLGDTNNDGLVDVGVTAPGTGSGDAAYVVFGKEGTGAANVTALGTGGYPVQAPATDKLGSSIAALGDTDGDAFADFAVGGKTSYVLQGKEPASTVDVASSTANDPVSEKITPPADTGYDSPVVSAAGDINDDSIPDVMLGYRDGGVPGQPGASYAVYTDVDGGGTTSLATLGSEGKEIKGTGDGDDFGAAVADAGASTGSDDNQRMLLTAPAADQNGDGSGTIYVVKSAAIAAAATSNQVIDKCWWGPNAYAYNTNSDHRTCRWAAVANGTKRYTDHRDATPKKRSTSGKLHVERGSTSLSLGYHLANKSKVPMYDSMGRTLAYIQHLGNKRFRIWDRNDQLVGTSARVDYSGSSTPAGKQRPRLVVNGHQCMAKPSSIDDYVMVGLFAPSFKTLEGSQKDINLRGFVSKSHIPEGSLEGYSKASYLKKFRGTCGPQPGKPAKGTFPNLTSEPFNPKRDRYQGESSEDSGGQYSNYYRPFFAEPTPLAAPTFGNLATNSSTANAIYVVSSTTGVRGGGLVRAILTRSDKYQVLAEIPYIDQNVPVGCPKTGKWQYVDANPTGARGNHIRGWIVKKALGPNGNYDSSPNNTGGYSTRPGGTC
jgi:hypothetical protein